ncbi:alpha/beta fold hydrolase [Streptomyces sp. NBC_01020]|uniref:thioesterase II family protein n=1 Tax=Streptomyces sp. NBC_01020 TaxID=2903722 RepID=UPI00386F2B8F|nr:alpha/beta fold hydrolase [Streptomyces sp. NBC_01020]
MNEVAAPERTSAWIRRFQPAPEAATQLVCFPHAGGSAAYFLPVARAMSPAVDVLAVQYPGRQDRRAEPCVEDVHQLADLAAAELLQWADRPLTLFGHSLGATLAFEVAVRLERAGIELTGLVASGRRAPSRYREERIHEMDDKGLIEDLKRLSGTDDRMLNDPEILAMILPYVRADYKAAETYRYRPGDGSGINCRIVAMTGNSDPHVSTAEARAWSTHTSGAFGLRVFSGGHFFINDHAPAVIQAISEFIDGRIPA